MTEWHVRDTLSIEGNIFLTYRSIIENIFSIYLSSKVGEKYRNITAQYRTIQYETFTNWPFFVDQGDELMDVSEASQDQNNVRPLHSKESKENQYRILEDLLKKALSNAAQFEDVQDRLVMILQDLLEEKEIELACSRQDRSNKHVICLVILPFKSNPDELSFAYETVLFPALRNVLEQHPYYWQVACSNDRFHDDTIDQNTEMWMKQAQAYIVDTSDRDPEVMIKYGNIEQQARKRKQPLIVLEREGTPQLSSKSGITRISYPDLRGPHAIDDIAKALESAFSEKPKIKELLSTKHDHYLSPLLLMSDEFSMNRQRATTLSSVYITMEYFVAVSVEDICRKMRGLSPHVARGYQEAVTELLGRL